MAIHPTWRHAVVAAALTAAILVARRAAIGAVRDMHTV